jgi:ABC-type sulfate/molybdate transport systems ATPase subunit
MTLEVAASLRLGAFDYDAAFTADQEIVVLFGHSGAGKSVTLQLIAGLLHPASGRIAIDGTVVFDSTTGVRVPPQARGTGYVVQDLALFPHLTVAQNVAFGMTGDGRADRTRQLLTLFGLDGMAARHPRTLSGGQQQRVALARALARDARLLLLDEPFSALDESLRSSLRKELLRLRKELGLTIIFVTHDLREAHLLADRLAVFDAGRLLQFDRRETVFRRPVSRRVAELTGVANIFRATVTHSTPAETRVLACGLALRCETPPGLHVTPGTEVDVAIRAERVNLRRVTAGDGLPDNMLTAEVVQEDAYGSTHTLQLRPNGPGPALEVELASRPYEVLGVAAQKSWTVEMPAADLHVMPAGD